MTRTVLLIDDDSSVLDAITLMLAGSGFEVLPASSAQEGLRHLKTRSVDLIITDILMPEMEGIELISHLRTAGSTVPIVAMSGGGALLNSDFLGFAGKLGAKAVIEKPFRRDALIEAIEKALAQA